MSWPTDRPATWSQADLEETLPAAGPMMTTSSTSQSVCPPGGSVMSP